MNKILMSTAAYPWTTDSTSFVNNNLTDFSMPASEMYNRNSEGNYLLSKPITDITQHVDGTVSFAFHTSNNPDGIVNIETTYTQDTVYDLCGKRMANASQLLPGIYIVNGKKRIISRR
jgi:hypothetical protein